MNTVDCDSKTKDDTLIHETAVVEKGAKLGSNVKIGAFCFVGKDAVLNDNVELKPHVVVTNKVTIGVGAVIHSFAAIGGAPQNINHHGVGAEVIIGDNSIIREHVTINIGTEVDGMKTIIGNNCFIMIGCHIAHDCVLGNNVIMANNATLGGHIHIEDNVFIGGLTAIHQFVRIGKYAMVGGASAVGRDVSPFIMARGNEAYVIGVNSVGLKRGGFSDADICTVKESYKILFDTSPGKNIDVGLKNLEQKFKDNEHVQYILDFLRTKSKRGIYRPKVSENGQSK
ncbi:MAG: acyl-ACP--UDP-N-acetylglucosamine O-acyltransferase [Rickettsiales bacterium]|nr:acyl-ACP--UDP-N-acetylglucosamine O-acyltransferase [Rickettsiales bacterium]